MIYPKKITKEEIQEKLTELKKTPGRYWLSLAEKQNKEDALYKIVHVENNSIEAAIHKDDFDIYYILDGNATFTYKGELEGGYSKPGEMDNETIRGTGIKNGETSEIKKGDLIIIPKNTPHAMTTKKSITFLTIKVKQP
jgi:mannose-6-phosphate isomerase-like protein (cupin superfamily)